MISTFKSETEFLTDEGCFIVEMLNTESDPAVSIARARVPAGTTTQLHCLEAIAERYVILAGTGIPEIDGLRLNEVRAMDVVAIPAGISQRITNAGKMDLEFLCICSPRFVPTAYRNLEFKDDPFVLQRTQPATREKQ